MTSPHALLLATTCAAFLTIPSPAPAAPPAAADLDHGGVFVLGVDGLDPVVLQRLMDRGEMPHFARLAREGTFQELGTSNPPQSPVAWSNFVTGMNPGGHGIFDFIHRDPRTYGPLASATPPPSGDEPAVLPFFGLSIPLWGGDEIINNRGGKPFWDYLDEAGVEVEVYRMPGNFPPTPSEAFTLSGMGTDDLRALNGKYFWYTDELVPTGDKKAELVIVSRDDEDGDGFAETIRTSLAGPPNTLQSDPATGFVEIPMTIVVDPVEDVCWISISDQDVLLAEGEWSDWTELSFDLTGWPWGMGAAVGGIVGGMVRFYVKEIRPNLKLYVSPVNFLAEAPAAPITTPDDGYVMLHEELGNYYTQGMPEETNALKDGLFDDSDFVEQVKLVHKDGHAMLDLALRRFDRGDTTFMYLSDIDLQCHMLWHHGDPKFPAAPRHPAYRPGHSEQHSGHLEDFYRGVDDALGRVRERLPDDTLLVVMSDHGFQPYTRKVHLNAVLRDLGYLVLRDGQRTGTVTGLHWEDGEPQLGETQVDWSRTHAYGLGFNGIYLNRAGREAGGIVTEAEADALADEIIADLLALSDPKTGRRPVLRADKATDVYSGARLAEAPDIIVGYDAGYGCSDKSTLGEITEETIVDNLGGEFTGNHLMAPEVVPGIILVNRQLQRDGHDLTDVTATLLDVYGLPPGDGMVGRSIF